MSSIESFYIIFEIKKLADICWFSSSTDHLLAGSEGGFKHVLRGISALMMIVVWSVMVNKNVLSKLFLFGLTALWQQKVFQTRKVLTFEWFKTLQNLPVSRKLFDKKCSESGELTSILKRFLVYSCRLQENWRFVVSLVVKFQKFLHTPSWKKWKCNFSI